MLILSIRTDDKEAEVGLFDNTTKLGYTSWQAYRELSATIHTVIKDLLAKHDTQLRDITGIIVYQGPGSFTGLRIGLSVANALAYSLPAAIVGTTGQNWLKDGQSKLLAGQNQQMILPEYGAPVHITKPKH